jgi:hypothetical protein
MAGLIWKCFLESFLAQYKGFASKIMFHNKNSMLRIITFDQNTHSTELQQLDKKLLSACFVLKINQFHHHWCYELFGYLSSDVKYGLHVKVTAPYFTYRFPTQKKKKKKKFV